MAIVNFDKKNVVDIRKEINEALAAIGAKHGVSLITDGTLRFDDKQFYVKVTGSVTQTVGADGQVEATDKSREDFKKYYAMFGFKADDLDRHFKNGGRLFKLVGLNPKKHKYTAICQEIGGTGKRFEMFPKDVLGAMSRYSSAVK